MVFSLPLVKRVCRQQSQICGKEFTIHSLRYDCLLQEMMVIEMLRWLVMFFVGLLTGLVASLIDFCVIKSTDLKFSIIKKCILYITYKFIKLHHVLPQFLSFSCEAMIRALRGMYALRWGSKSATLIASAYRQEKLHDGTDNFTKFIAN